MSKIRISADDGCASDLRLADLCAKYEIDCTFYLPVEWHSLAYGHGYKPLEYAAALDLSKEFQIGSHTITHRHLTRIPLEEARYEIVMSKMMLEQLFFNKVTKFAPPRGYTNEALTNYTLDLYESQRLTKQPNLVHIHPNSGANNELPWMDAVDEMTEELFCHSWELDRFELWKELESYLGSLG